MQRSLFAKLSSFTMFDSKAIVMKPLETTLQINCIEEYVSHHQTLFFKDRDLENSLQARKLLEKQI